ncbi:protein phosphatase 1 regulatory subunit 37 [Molossus molossus]|uniref:Protein phosphatase 1 regulatory subunit 37 n=1 Tax=Molossus molossus TaxID=27622 RepID=A0A7J8CA82_MOLMO|nr:protein phosphatase 1 regulatory subunit 37 [Molossus molossus]XP_036131133.1 protein phosphatase 1 regulatory subunit 37 [Molossus molossus]XP_036131134.1 protein phosphatase 1 regulatory subunit 37 [Molossus molossus]KAF6407774.1 protein phosphatase 1 regulatory subunit 37 [Molossus molossus]
MEIPPQEAPPGPGADGDAEEAPAEARSPSPASSPADGRLKAAAKRVTFPSDEDIVSGAVEPKDPWRHAQNVTVDEVIGAYKQACQKLNCRQIPKLLRQLQEFTDLGHRIDCLDLKGEKLDYKACEALEEVFKRLQFKVVDLEQTNLDEDGASALFDMIEYYESATHLNISFNKHIGTRGWQAAAHMMRKTSCLQYLDARNTPLLDHSAPFVARALRIRSSLAVLHLENASLSGRPLMLLATALKMNMNLRELYLADNKLNGLQDSAQLGNLLKFNCSLQILDLRNNHVLDSGLAYICEGLKEQRKGLVTLVLWNNQLTHTGMAFLGMTLPHTQSLETLNLGHNPVGNEGVRNLKNGLIGNRSVLRLGLASTKLTCEGAVAVAEFIAESPRLLRLDLRENEIKTGGLMALSLALKVNHSLLRLDLDREPKKEAVKSFIETQKALLAEIQNGCKRNFVLAREREEEGQRLQLSASMPEIMVTEPQPDEPGDEPAAQAQENGDPAPGPGLDSDSDSDSEGEEGEEEDGERAAVPCPTPVPPTDSLGSGDRSPPGSPSSPTEQRISVSSPGRGHKVFVVTRVESPPESAELPAPPSPCAPAPPALSSPSTSPALPSAEALSTRDPGSSEPQPQPEPPPAGPALPNGLKPEFALALPPEPPPGPEAKAGSCGLEHELSCSKNEKELEELLLEASQESGQETL